MPVFLESSFKRKVGIDLYTRSASDQSVLQTYVRIVKSVHHHHKEEELASLTVALRQRMELSEQEPQDMETNPDSDISTLMEPSSSSSFCKTPTEEDSDPPRKCARSCWDFHPYQWKAGLVFFILLDGVLIALLVSVTVHLACLQSSAGGFNDLKNRSRGSTSELLEDSAFCLPCSQVYLSHIEVLQNRSKVSQKRDARNNSLCCAQPHDDLKTLVGEMFIRISYGRDRAKGVVNVIDNNNNNNTKDENDDGDQSDLNNPYLLLELDKGQDPIEVNNTHKVPLKISKREVPTDHRDTSPVPAHFRNGTVKIANPGHFYIHSHVPFIFPPDHSVTLTQYVYRVRNGGETLLLENSVFPCDVSMQDCERSFVAGLFLLEKGDEVVLRVSNHSYVDREKDMEFGVHRL